MITKRFAMLMLAALMSIFLLAACAAAAPPTEPPAIPTPEPVEETVTLREFAFDPPQQTVPAGAEVTLVLENEGLIVHSYFLMEDGYAAEAPWDEEDAVHVLEEIEVEPGGTGTLTFTAPSEAGTYQVVCHEPGHMEAGMVGELVVTAP